jgi:dUTP pyrophosphatase
MLKLQIKRLHPDARIPSYAHAGDAGMDMYAIEEVTVLPGARVSVGTGIAVALPEGFVALVWDKSGLSHKHGLKTLGGVIDAGYRGEYTVGLINLSDAPYTIQKGDKIAQMLIQKVEHPEIEEVDELDLTSRGEGAFGSTGK